MKRTETKTNRMTVLRNMERPISYWGPSQYMKFRGRCQTAHTNPRITLDEMADLFA